MGTSRSRQASQEQEGFSCEADSGGPRRAQSRRRSLVIPVMANAWDGGFHRGHPFHPGPFHPRHFHHGGCCFFGGFAAGVFTGAVLGSAFAPVYAYPAPVYAYPAPVYAAPPPTYWYYCRSLGAYYPYVPNCPEPCVPVLAQ